MSQTRTVVIRRMLPEDAAAVAGLTSQLGYPASEGDIKRRSEIWGLVVAEAARRTGVGRMLVEAAEEWAVMRGLDAHAFYEQLGYKVVKTQNAFRKSLS